MARELLSLRASEERYDELSAAERGAEESPLAVFERWCEERDAARHLVEMWRTWAAGHLGFQHDDASMRSKIDVDEGELMALRAQVERMRAVVEAAARLRPVTGTAGGALDSPATIVDDDAARDLAAAIAALDVLDREEREAAGDPERFRAGDPVDVMVSDGSGRWDAAHVEEAPCEHGYVVCWDDPEWEGAFWADAERVRARGR